MLKTLTAGVLALALTLTSVTATPARAEISEGDAVVGLITLLLLGAAISNRDNDNPQVDQRGRGENWRVLPAHCLTTVNTRGGEVRMFGLRCLNRNYAHVNRLPARCEISVRGPRHMRHGYVPRCLRHEGFRMEGARRR